MSLKSAFRRLSRAFSANDAKAFDDALEELEEGMEEKKSDDEDPDTIEVHNHIPGQDTARGQLPEKDPPGFDKRHDDRRHDDRRHDDRRHDDRRADDAFDRLDKCMDRFDRVCDDVEALKKWASEEGMEPEHQEDQLENLGAHAIPPQDVGGEPVTSEEENLEMDRYRDDDMHLDRRHDDKRHDDRRHDDRRDRRHDDRVITGRRRDDKRHDDKRHDDKRHDDEANKRILGELEFEAPPGTGVDAKRANDSRYLEESFQDTVAKAEIIAPGIRLPAFNVGASPTRTAREMFTLRKTALDLAYNQPATRGMIDQAMNGRTLDTRSMGIGATRVLFNAVAGAVASSNNQRATDGSGSLNGSNTRAGGNGARIQSLADINRVNRERFGRKSA